MADGNLICLFDSGRPAGPLPFAVCATLASVLRGRFDGLPKNKFDTLAICVGTDHFFASLLYGAIAFAVLSGSHCFVVSNRHISGLRQRFLLDTSPPSRPNSRRVSRQPGATTTLEPTFTFKRAVYDA